MLIELGLTEEVRSGLLELVALARQVPATRDDELAAMRWLGQIAAAAAVEDAVLRELGALVVPCGAADVGCKASVLFLPGPRGASIPLDATSSSHIYRIAVTTREAVPIGTGAMINHYRTCKDPGRFTQRTRKP